MASTLGEAQKEDRANALLIAAAPDLLEACKRLLASTGDACGVIGYPHDEATCSCCAARAAIAKAEKGE